MIRFFLAFLLLFATPALGQTVLPAGSATPELATQVERIAEAARKEGLAVIVMTPGEAKPVPAMMDTMRAERFLAARARLSAIFSSGETLVAAVVLTIQRIEAMASLRGQLFDYAWVVRGLATALLGGFIGWLALRPVVRAGGRMAARNRQRLGITHGPRTTADKARALLTKTMFAITFAVAIYAVALLVAVILDSGFEPTRRIVFECLTAFLVYRLLRFGFAWPLTAYDDGAYRIVGLDDASATRLYRTFTVCVLAALVPIAVLRFLIVEGHPAATGGPSYGALTPEHAALLTIAIGLIGTLALAALVLTNWHSVQMMFEPRDGAVPSAWSRIARALSHATPLLVLAYGAFALLAFLFRLGTDQPAPAAIIVTPFVIGYLALVAYAVALIAIQAIYERRERRWAASTRAEAERLAQEAAAMRARLADDEEMDTPDLQVMRAAEDGEDAPLPEYRPIMRGFLEKAALVVIVTVSLGELGRSWGVRVGEDGNPWAGFLDMILAASLAWLAYRAVTVAIDRKLADEAGPEVDADAIGNEGGAGASRLATLLPILRWVVVAVLLVTATIIVLSRFGIDIGPLLASAGVIGIAVGFGAQKLIQDIFSGAFFLLDDAFRRGEYIDIEGTKGTVEKISIRSFQLRHHLGALHTIPFGEIRQLTNFSRDWVLMKLPLRLTYDTDIEKVRKLIKKLGQSLLEHPEIGDTFMQPLKSQGVYKMEDSAMIVRVKFMTRPGEQFVTRKVVYAAIQELFAREGIRFAHKEVTVRLADTDVNSLTPEQQNAVSAAAREVIDAEEAENRRPAEAAR